MKRVLFSALVVIAIGALATEAGASTAVPDLSGTWMLNEEESDDPREGLEELKKSRGQDRKSGRSGRFAQRVREKKVAKAKEAMAELEDRPRQFEIEQAADAVTFVYGDNRQQTFPTDGSSVKPKDDLMKKATAEWVDQSLVIRGETKRGKDIEQTYTLGPDGSQLFVTMIVRTDRGEMKNRRVYDAAK